jgi:hypothetical protein
MFLNCTLLALHFKAGLKHPSYILPFRAKKVKTLLNPNPPGHGHGLLNDPGD